MSAPVDRLMAALAERYAIQRELGAGGMATVYLAEDLKHKRKVAVKVLRPELSAILGGDRFLNEIEVTANLQHPNILPLYDSGEADTFLYYVMPFVEGESLRDKLAREKQLGVDEAVEIAKATAAALSYAHSRGVIHRDIKPENILLHSGQALVADFGIALAVTQAGGSRLTETGLSLGTPSYMSPEQATGDRELDARSDVYALGCVVYEMLVGDPPHTGSTVQAIVAKILSERPSPIRQTRDLVPDHVQAAVEQALAKTPADRFATAAQFVEALTNPAFALPRAASLDAPAPARPFGRLTALFAAVALVSTAWLLWAVAQPGSPPRVTRYGLGLAPSQRHIDLVEVSFALSPDGSNFAYVGPGDSARQLWVKARDHADAAPLPGTDGARQPIVSPDGRWVAYSVADELRKTPIAGGSSVSLADSVETVYGGATWLDDGTIVYVGLGHSLRQVGDAGGVSVRAWTPPSLRYAVLPVALPGGRAVLFTLCDNECLQVQELWVLDLATGEARLLLPEVAQAWYAPTEHLVYVRRDGAVFAVPFALGALEVRGQPIPVLDSVQVDAGIMPDFALSRTGQLARIRASFEPDDAYTVVWVDRRGAQRPIDSAWTWRARSFDHGWALSPDDSRLAIRISTDGNDDIWVKELDRGPLSRVTFDSAADLRPRWMPDGEALTFISNRAGDFDLYRKRADGTGSAELVVDAAAPIWEGWWSAEVQAHVLRVGGDAPTRDVWMSRSGATEPLISTPHDEKAITLSPDGRWLAYQSNETGRPEVFVRPFPAVRAGKWQVSTDGGVMPLWGRRGRELFYVSARREMVAASVTTRPSFAVGGRQTLFDIPPEIFVPADQHYTMYEVSRDGQRFVMARRVDAGNEPGMLVIVENWFEELKEKLGN